jgi:hypothetical protein
MKEIELSVAAVDTAEPDAARRRGGPFLKSGLVTDERKDCGRNGVGHTLGFVWTTPHTTRKPAFVLTTSSKEDAEIQAFATASVLDGKRP